MSNIVKLPAALVSSLRCPACNMQLDSVNDQLICTNEICGKVFPIIDGIPVLINEANSIFSIDGFVRGQSTFFDLEQGKSITATIERCLPNVHRKHRTILNYERVARLLLEQSPTPNVLIVGGSILGQGMEPLLQHCPPIQLIESDVSFGPRTMVIADAHDIPFDNETFDGVIAQAVLEHVLDPWRCVSEMHRVLKPNGLIYAQTPFMYPVHSQYDFTRFTHLGHRRLLGHFEEISSGVINGPGTALALAYQYFLLSFATSRMKRGLLRMFAQLTSFYLKFFDNYLETRPGALDAASGYYFLGKRSKERFSDRDILSQYRGALTQ
jgi:SAM-dependent methyltransferase/uncharacterized protein YbaR (Trm112 family)